MSDPPTLRERLVRVEEQYKSLSKDLDKNRELLEANNRRLEELTALLNQGKGMKMIVSAIFALGGAGGLYSLMQLLSNLSPHR